jgi:preprotein translocase subunit SecB
MVDETKEPGIKVNQIFLGKAHFEHDPTSLNQPAGTLAGEHQLQVTVTAAVSEDKSSGLVTVRVQTGPDNKGCYRFMAEMVGLFERVRGEENMEMVEYLNRYAAPSLFPFLREAVANLTGRGRFGPVWLKPLNFAAMKPEGVPAVVAASQ